MKKFLLLILVFMMTFSLFSSIKSVYAAENISLFQDFEKVTIPESSTTPPSMAGLNFSNMSGKMYTVKENGNNLLAVRSVTNAAETYFGIDTNFRGGKFYVSFDYKALDNNGYTNIFIDSADPKKTNYTERISIFSANMKGGNLTDDGAGALKSNTFSNIKLEIDYPNRTIKTYVDGEFTKTKNFTVPETHAGVYVLRFWKFSNNAGLDSTALFDNIKMFSETPDVSFAEKKYQLAPGGNKKLDYVFSPSNLDLSDLQVYSTNPQVAEFKNNYITALKTGTANINVISAKNGIDAVVPVLVLEKTKNTTIKTVNYEFNVKTNELKTSDLFANSSIGDVEYKIAVPAKNGTANIEGNKITYLSDKNYIGQDECILSVWNASGDSAYFVVYYNVKKSEVPEINPFKIIDGEVATSVQPRRNTYNYIWGAIAGQTATNNVVVDVPSRLYIAKLPLHGEASVNGNNILYKANPSYVGFDEFVIGAISEKGIWSTKDVQIICYPNPSQAKDILQGLKEKRHPYIKATDANFNKVKDALAVRDPYITDWYNLLKERADYEKDKTFVYNPSFEKAQPGTDNWFMGVSRPILYRVEPLAFMYRMTGDVAYADAIWRDMAILCDVGNLYKVAGVKNINRWAYDICTLANAEAVDAISLAYDWLYDYLSDEQKSLLKKTVKEQSFDKAVVKYTSGTNGWNTETSNWGSVCNGGFLVGALTFGTESDMIDSASVIYSHALKGLTNQLGPYSNGAYPESPGYWSYASRYFTYAMSALVSSVGTCYGLDTINDIIKNFGNYLLYASTDSLIYNTGDGGAGMLPSAHVYMWLINHYKEYNYVPQVDKYIKLYRAERASDREISPFELLYYDSEMYKKPNNTKLDAKLTNPNVMSIALKSSYSQYANQLFLHGGQNLSYHGHLDSGTFFLDMMGVRWIDDGWSVPYGVATAWDFDYGRWMIFNARAEAHSTILIGPDKEPDQYPYSWTEITKFESGVSSAFGILDMSRAYPKAKQAIRGIQLFDNRQKAIIRDEIVNIKPEDVYWNIITSSMIEISDDGKSAILETDAKRIRFNIIQPSTAKFTKTKCVPLSTSAPQPVGSPAENPATRLSIILEKVEKADVAVGVEAYYDGIEPYVWKDQKLADWTVSNDIYAKLDSISLDGVPINNFDPSQSVYEYVLKAGEKASNITATSNGGTVEIKQSGGVGDFAKITVKQNGLKDGIYYVTFSKPSKFNNQLDLPVAHIIKVTATGNQDGYGPEKTIDCIYNKESRWSNDGPSYIEYELEKVYSISDIGIAFWLSTVRTYPIKIEFSSDGQNWTTAYEGTSVGNTDEKVEELGLRHFKFKGENAKFIRIHGNGSNVNGYIHIVEMEAYVNEN